VRIPRRHVADETVARILVASKRVRSGETPSRAETGAAPLQTAGAGAKSPPPGLVKVAEGGQPGGAQAAPGGAELPGLDESGLDLGAVLGGADSIDALLGGP